MSDVLNSWLSEQTRLNRVLILALDSLAEPNPVTSLYSAGLMQRTVQLYRGTQYTEFAPISPWLTELPNPDADAFRKLLDDPQRNWGWIGSMDQADLDGLTQHWRARMIIDEDGERSLFRFQDNRVLARCLANLSETERPLLLGPISSVLYWDEEQWKSDDNAKPGMYPVPNPAPWLRTPESGEQARSILRDNLKRWLLTYHVEAAASLAETRVVSEWLEEQMDLMELWQWKTPEQRQLMLSRRLSSECMEDIAWKPLPGETPEVHFLRCQRVFADSSSGAEV
ncbi:DUF4123 domain-containing protein [Pseudomonas nunensis]|uniref:DUF4123 domain-containing protein n=1 Tax=Pseudomonas nunensis TaxID=2961896 RepID=A0ABY5ERS7_9PSED|nr:DUF4123 domain-containing protein [Pseudomonas nunensis]KPN90728.1 hypothetical protein AL066_10440 [Pseudomonas nunensis]MCL5228539.1 DUF4123 domain-containing protein [Pseudomonas nunensis]UTO16987.1 DUF4123 domain-containing protein [Pseudomonas nunensis]